MKSRAAVLAFLLLAVAAPPARAHRVNVFAYLEKGRVVCECYFQDGSPCKGCALKFYDAKETLLHTGTTDEKGGYAFPAPDVDVLLVVLDAGRGHRAEYRLRLRSAPGKAEAAPPPGEERSGEGSARREGAAPGADAAGLGRRIDDLSDRVDGLAKEVGLLRQERKGITVEKVLLGVVVLLALGAFVMALRGRNAPNDRETPPGN